MTDPHVSSNTSMQATSSLDDTMHTLPKSSRSTKSFPSEGTNEQSLMSPSSTKKRYSRPRIHIEDIQCKSKANKSLSNIGCSSGIIRI